MRGTPQKVPHKAVLEQAYDCSLDGIPAYVGGDAERAANQINARGYAFGGAIALGQEPALHTTAEEVGHALQQQRGGHSHGASALTRPGDAAEVDARQAADHIACGLSASTHHSLSPATVARQQKDAPIP